MRRAELLMLLLCCRMGRSVQPLTRTEYRDFAQRVKQAAPEIWEQPLTCELLRALGCSQEEAEKISDLLLSEQTALRYLEARPQVTALTRLSHAFPSELRRLEECPAALFCVGDVSLFAAERKIALVGNRALSAEAAEFAARIGRLVAEEGCVLVSGGATGADSIAQEACLQAGGSVICFCPSALPRRARENLLLCSDEGYAQGFTGARALRRNHYIHALAERTYVAQCSECHGGTWSGCVDNLQRGLSELYVFDDGSAGAQALQKLGAILTE